MEMKEMKEYLEDNLDMTFNDDPQQAVVKLTVAMLSDVQEMIERDMDEQARQLINRVKFLQMQKVDYVGK